MFRFVIGLLTAAAVFFGWQWYAEKDSYAGERGARRDLFEAVQTKTVDPAARLLVKTGTEQQSQDRSKTSVAGHDDRLVEAVLAGDAAALAVGFRTLQEAPDSLRSHLAAALLKRGKAAESKADVDAMLDVLGSGNAFLHTPEGREWFSKTLTQILRLDREKAIIRTTALIEKCMRGPIARTDQAAYTAVNEVYRHHKNLVAQVVFNPSRLTKARSYKVKPGDRLDRIAARYRKQGINVEGWTLCIVNRIGRPNRLQAGRTIKIPIEPIWARVEKESFLMAVYVGDAIVRLYWIGHGKEGHSTPETTFTVADKLKNPDWYAPDGNTYAFGHSKNILGRQFVKFHHASLHGFGAHGTAAPETIRTRASLGCIRMLDADIEEFFLFIPRGAKVVVAASR